MLNLILETCHYCKKDVGPDGVTAAEKIYHRPCFKCFKCDVNLVVKFYVHQGQPSCEACYKQDTCPSCTLCGLIVDGDGVKIGGEEGERIYHTQCVRSNYVLVCLQSPSCLDITGAVTAMMSLTVK